MRRLASIALVAVVGLSAPAPAPAAAAVKKPVCPKGQTASPHRVKVVRKKTVRTSSGKRKVVRVTSYRTTWRCAPLLQRIATPLPGASTAPAVPVVLTPAPAVAAPAVTTPVSGAPTVSAPAAPVVDDQGPGGALTLTARDPDAQNLPAWGFTASRSTVPRGAVAFDFVNWGGDPHNLWLRRQGGTAREVIGLTDGDRGADPGTDHATLRLTNGTYTLFCAIPAHEGLGMRATLVVE